MVLPAEYPDHEEELSRALFAALMELMQTVPIDKLSVGEITARAHVSRASFYRRYKDKYDLLNRSYERILENTLFTVHQGTKWKEAIYKIYRVIGEHAAFFNNAFCSSDQNSLRNYIFERTMRLEMEILQRQGVDVTKPAVQYRLRSYVAGGLELTVTWVREGAVFPLEELVEIFVEMVPVQFQRYFV